MEVSQTLGSRVSYHQWADVVSLLNFVEDWRSKASGDGPHYKDVARRFGFSVEHRSPALHRKRLDLFKEYSTSEMTYRAAVEIETSTIENGFNDLLKIMQMLRAREVEYGFVLFVQSNRSRPAKLRRGSLQSNIVEGLNLVLDDFRGRLFLLHFDPGTTLSLG